MRWILIVGAVLFAVAFLLVAAWTSTAPRPAAAVEPPSREPPPAVAEPPPLPPAVPALPAAASPAPVAGATADAEEPGHDPDALRRALEPIRRHVFAGLADMRWRIAHCDLAGATVFVTAETLDGAVRISDVRLEGAPGPGARAGDERLPVPERAADCVRGVLAGNVIGSPTARAGRTFEMPFEPGPIE